MATVKMVTTGDLFSGKYKFILPAYQRGYRWRSPGDGDLSRIEDSQVLQLLDDINDYVTNEGFNGLFYCMQPVIVAPTENENEFYLIDGQQRLTTFFLLYHYLKFKDLKYEVWDDDRIPPEKKSEETFNRLSKSIFSLKYENRDIEDWLNNIHLNAKEISKDTADKYFLSSAYLCIVKWFKDKDKEQKSVENKFRDLLSREISATNVEIGKTIPSSLQFIWYELDKEESIGQEKLFQRINKGIAVAQRVVDGEAGTHGAGDAEALHQRLRASEDQKFECGTVQKRRQRIQKTDYPKYQECRTSKGQVRKRVGRI